MQKFAIKRSLFQALCQEFFTVICNRKSVFWKYFLSNIIIVSCVIALLIPALFYTYSNEIQKRVNDYQKVCHSFLTDWNQQLDLMSSTLQNIQNSKGFSRLKLINGELKLEDYTYLSSANDNLLLFSGFQKNIIDIFVIFRNSNILISKYYSFDNLTDFSTIYTLDNPALLSAPPDITKAKYTVYPETKVSSPIYQNRRVVPVKIELFNQLNNWGTAFILLNAENFFNLNFESIIDSNGYIRLSVDDSEILFCGTKPTGKPASEYTIIQTASDKFDLELGISNQDLYFFYNTQIQTLIKYLILSYLLGILFAALFTFKWYKPIKDLLFLFISKSEEHLNNSEFNYIKMIHIDNQEKLERYRISMTSYLIDYLLITDGGKTPEYEIPSILKNEYVLFYVRISFSEISQGTLNHDYSFVSGFLRVMDQNWLVHAINENIFIIITPAKDQCRLITLIQNFHSNCSHYKINAVCSEAVQGASNLRKVYEETRSMFYRQQEKGIPLNGDSIYSLEYIDSLFHLIAAGNREATENSIKPLFSLGFDLEKHRLISTVITMAVKNSPQLHTESLSLPTYSIKKSELEMQEEFFSIIETICAKINFDNQKNKNEIKIQILTYIHENIQDANLCVASIAEHFHLSESRLLCLIKEATGNTLPRMINDMRMNSAKELITSGKIPLHLIYKETGFNSYNSFYKAFKRKYGISPRELKDMLDNANPNASKI